MLPVLSCPGNADDKLLLTEATIVSHRLSFYYPYFIVEELRVYALDFIQYD